MHKNKDIAIKFAKDNGFDNAIRSVDKWNGVRLHVAIFNPGPDGNPPCTGYPQFIIFEDKKPRFATPKETYEIMGIKFMPKEFTQRLEDCM